MMRPLRVEQEQRIVARLLDHPLVEKRVDKLGIP